MTTSPDDYIIVGKVGSTFGVHGFLKIETYTEVVTDILNYQPWYLSFLGAEKWRLYSIKASEIKSNRLIVQFEGIDSPEQAKLLTGKQIAIPQRQLPALPKNEYYWAD